MNSSSAQGGFSPELLFENRIVCEWLPTEDAAKYLGITANALRILVCRGKVTTYKFGRRLRFKIADLRSLLKLEGEKR